MDNPGLAVVLTTTTSKPVEVPGVLRRRTFRLAEEQMLPHRAAAATHDHLTLYEHDDVDALIAASSALQPSGEGLLSIYRTILDTTEPSKLSDDAPPRPTREVPAGPPGLFFAFTRPVSADTAAEYNRWYNENHMPDALHLEGFRRGRRFELVEGDAEATGPYLAVYELDNVAATPFNRDLQDWLSKVATVYLGPDGYDKTFTKAYIFEELPD